MTAHQLIYTSCRRGINSVNDGQQVFSYDAGFPTEQIAAMAPTMTYRGPDLPPGVPMTEALVPTYTKAFTYTTLGSHADLALNTYLGKDYMGPTGRFGNFLSHHLVLEQLPSYPAEFIGSSVFRTSMDYDEVNNPEPPSHLPAPDAVRGGVVTRDSVRLFLESDGRWQQFTRMTACLLAGAASQKRVVINDRPEHVAQWIGALGYVLRPHCTAGVSFSTYEYNPMRGDWRIVGAIGEGTLYDATAGTAYTFDLVAGTMPDLDLPADFADFLEAGLMIASDSLIAFHGYVETEFPAYRVADETLYGAYGLFRLGEGEFSADALEPVCTFLEQYGSEAQRLDFIQAVLSRPDGVSFVTDSRSRPVLLGLINNTARSGLGLLELTFNAEGNLLDSPDSQAAAGVVWSSFYDQMVSKYRAERIAVYRELASYPRLDELLGLFSVSLREGGDHPSPKAQFDEVIAVLPSPRDFPRLIDAYYAFATTPADRAHLLRFIMAQGVGFTSAGTLVAEALSEVSYGQLTEAQTAYVKQVWQWVRSSDVDVRQCERLWYLVSGLVLLSARSPEKLETSVDWVVKTAPSLGLCPTPDEPTFVEWVVPHLVRVAESGAMLHAVLTKVGLRVTQPLIDMLWSIAFRRFDKSTWFKVAECVFAYREDRLLDLFAQSCKKMASRDIADLHREAEVRYAKDPRSKRDWETVYAVTQQTAMRSVRARIGKRGEGRDRTDG